MAEMDLHLVRQGRGGQPCCQGFRQAGRSIGDAQRAIVLSEHREVLRRVRADEINEVERGLAADRYAEFGMPGEGQQVDHPALGRCRQAFEIFRQGQLIELLRASCPCARLVEQRRLVRRDARSDRKERPGLCAGIEQVARRHRLAHEVEQRRSAFAFTGERLQRYTQLAADAEQRFVNRADEFTAEFAELPLGREVAQRVHAPASAAAGFEHLDLHAGNGQPPGRHQSGRAATDHGNRLRISARIAGAGGRCVGRAGGGGQRHGEGGAAADGAGFQGCFAQQAAGAG